VSDKDLPDIELEQFAVDWAVDDPSASMRSWRRREEVMVFHDHKEHRSHRWPRGPSL